MAAPNSDEGIEGLIAIFILGILLVKILPSLMNEVEITPIITLLLYSTAIVAIIGSAAHLWEELFG